MRTALSIFLLFCAPALFCAEPDYSAWDALLSRYYDPMRGVNYRALKARDARTLQALRQRLGSVDPTSLSRNEQLAYWINLYNANAVGIVVDHYPVKSIRDISTDPIRRLNVFKKDFVPFRGGRISLDEIEHERIRKRFRDPRIHFVINCAARSCPPMPEKAVRGATLEETLEAATIAFLSMPGAIGIDRRGGATVVTTTKIMDWFKEDFQRWGGTLAFLRRYMSPNRQRLLVGTIRIAYHDYDWSLNEWR
jgi:hypothetical protein